MTPVTMQMQTFLMILTSAAKGWKSVIEKCLASVKKNIFYLAFLYVSIVFCLEW